MTDPYQQQPNQQGQYYGADGYPNAQQPQQPPSAPLPVPYSAPYSGGYPAQPYSAPYATPNPYAQYPPGYVPTRQSGMAIAGMIIGILALITFWVPFWDVIAALTAIGLSWAGIVQAGKPGYSGQGMGIAGLVCGIVAAIPAVIFLVLFFTAIAATSTTCAFYC
ncbi:DUF4190 domain-containing protein [Amycolatopsis rhabdoformis]|uniref:DUF4190 domain-containing protein n=1 Tax=Amycolatopsis rhabdoformis TaxID=1448059 RepID=A0ABZ1HZ63_9PSEU|nr:DUF4190 domain-containing protein [Amycolatopsis rhabdoformis]WSE27472.1 DUF4190 domain-containing protein [Amycolatopsis rhabdoformis]